ncbi:EAL domain-containing protein [Sulfurovum sp. CS9]|uniref:EAL domain-containing protein n=1 Tax=Sulfurovum sp. CS9 TaxID=3391146 RepID=UPI0039EBFB65
MTPKHTNKHIFIIMGLLVLFALYLQYAVNESTEKLKTQEIQKAERYAQKIGEYIQLKTVEEGKLNLDKYPIMRDELNEVLRTFLTEEYQYIFLLRKDDKGHYRFLLDGSIEDPVEYNTIFFPKSRLFDSVYMTKEPQIIEQKEGVEHVWLSLLYPIVTDGKTQALLVLDLSEVYGEYLSDFNSPIVYIITLIQLFLLGSFFFLVYFAYQYHKLRKSILYDPVTSMYTKVYLQEFFDVEQVDRYNAMLIDIDEFKQINEKYGHEAGDTVLKLFSKEMLTLMPKEGRIIRLWGSEFLIIVGKENSNLEELAKKLFTSLTEKRYLIDNETISLTLSMSAIVIPEESESIQNIQRFLDEKLLEIKSRGKNALGIIGKISGDEIKYKNLDYIKEALEEERLTCLFQPIFNTKTQEVVKYEALVRLIDKEDPQKLISPDYFLDMIKGTTQYIKMSKLVLKEVFHVLHKYPELEISVNIDLDDLYNVDMMKLITKQLYRHRGLANRVTFEILENHEIKDYDEVALIFQQLKTFGSKIAIDDFGSGYANYVYLIKLDIDILKIDGSIILELLHSPERTKIMLNSIIDLAEIYQYSVVAEFVSSKEIYDMVSELGIEYSQGYYLGEPKPLDIKEPSE